MKIIKEIAIILIIYFLGMEISRQLARIILIPGNIIGMILLFILLNTKLLEIKQISITSKFLLGNIGFFFTPLCVAFYVLFDLIKPIWVQIFVVLTISNIIVLISTGKIVQTLINKEDKKKVEL